MQSAIVIIGAGPAGLTAAYQLSKAGVPCVVLEASPDSVGGIARTVEYKGFRFDVGPHRFFSKSREVENFWDELLPLDMLPQPRLTRIFYKGTFFNYPLRPWEALRKLGLFEAVRCGLSFVDAKLRPLDRTLSFEHWVSSQFGRRLFNIFFKTYTEKVWGMPTDQISADWAAQRVQTLSLVSALLNLGRRKNRPKTLIDAFRYPRRGPGMLWDACAEKIKSQGGEILLGTQVTSLEFDDQTQKWTLGFKDSLSGMPGKIEASQIISSTSIRALVRALAPAVSEATRAAAENLRYRDFITVNLIVKSRKRFPDHWIYIHDPEVKVGRISNFSSWSPEMSPSPELCGYGLEYFCFDHDGLWNSDDSKLLEMGRRELVQIGLADPEDIVDGFVIRQPLAYPVYDHSYRAHLDQVRGELDARFPSLHLVGRNGMHRYNNQDHSMMTAMLTVKNIIAGKALYDAWQVNNDAEYIEGAVGSESTTGLRWVPTVGEPKNGIRLPESGYSSLNPLSSSP